MERYTLGFLIRSLFIVRVTVAVGMAVSNSAGLTMKQSVLLAVPIGLFAASLMTLLFLARSGAKGNKRQQLFLLLAIEFVLTPLASAAALVAYFVDRG